MTVFFIPPVDHFADYRSYMRWRLSHIFQIVRAANGRYRRIAAECRRNPRPMRHARELALRKRLLVDTAKASSLVWKNISIVPKPVLSRDPEEAHFPDSVPKNKRGASRHPQDVETRPSKQRGYNYPHCQLQHRPSDPYPESYKGSPTIPPIVIPPSQPSKHNYPCRLAQHAPSPYQEPYNSRTIPPVVIPPTRPSNQRSRNHSHRLPEYGPSAYQEPYRDSRTIPPIVIPPPNSVRRQRPHQFLSPLSPHSKLNFHIFGRPPSRQRRPSSVSSNYLDAPAAPRLRPRELPEVDRYHENDTYDRYSRKRKYYEEERWDSMQYQSVRPYTSTYGSYP